MRHDARVTVQDTERLELPGEPASVARARDFVRRVLTDWGCDEAVDTVTLLTSELATNVVLHARTPFAVLVGRQDDDVRVDVLDMSSDPARRGRGGSFATSGRGIAMVERLSSAWGETGPEHLGDYEKGVWFRVPKAGTPLSTWEDAI